MNYRLRIPEDTRRALDAYVRGEHPYPFGSFVTAVLANDLVGAVLHADDNNRELLMDYASYLYNDMPMRTGDPARDMWGSYAAVGNTINIQKIAQADKEEGR